MTCWPAFGSCCWKLIAHLLGVVEDQFELQDMTQNACTECIDQTASSAVGSRKHCDGQQLQEKYGIVHCLGLK